jgi:hypothetical protein
MPQTQDELVKLAIEEITPYAKKKGVSIDYSKDELRFYGYSKESSYEIRYMLMDSINKKLMEAGIVNRVKMAEKD